MRNVDITRTVISSSTIRQSITAIFPDSIILDNHFNFISVSQNILEAIGYSRLELQGKSVSVLSHSYDLKKLLEKKLLTGYFEEEQMEISSRNEGAIMYGVSGFYLGLIADINGMIVLKFKNLDEINLMHDRLEAKTMELDRFVYLSAHSLRGPLATIKGLLNLTKMSNSQEETSFLLKQIDSFAEKLDDKLYRLIYFAESDKEHESDMGDVPLETICDALESNIREGRIDHCVQFSCVASDQSHVIKNGGVILSLLRNVVLFFCQQSKSPDNQLTLDARLDQGTTEFIVKAKGFLFTDTVREKLKNATFGYSEILNYPELINCYAAKKIIFKLRGRIQFIQTPSHEVVVLMTIPRDTQLSGA